MAQNRTNLSDARHFGANRYRALDAWRGVCAVMIALLHAPLQHAAMGMRWFDNTALFVDFFFVLSGFVICHAYGARIRSNRDAIGFMIRRFGRTWPLHAAILAVFAVIELAKLVASRFASLPLDGQPFTENLSPDLLAANLLFVQALHISGGMSWNGPAWSVAVEFYVYLIFALVLLLAGARTALFALLAIAAALALAATSPTSMFVTYDFGFLRCVYGFFVGCVAYRLSSRLGAPRLGAATLIEFVALGAVVMFIAATGDNATSFMAPLLFALVILVFAQERGVVSRAMTMRAPQALGRWSYSIYMVHWLVFSLWKIAVTLTDKFAHVGPVVARLTPTKQWVFATSSANAAALLALLASVIVTAAFTYRFIEQPARDAFNRLARRWDEDVVIPATRIIRVAG